MSSASLSLMPRDISSRLEKEQADQFICGSLSTFPNVCSVQGEILQCSHIVFPTKLWNKLEKAGGWSTDEQALFQFVCLTLSDFWSTCQQKTVRSDSERTHWCEKIIPIFEHFGSSNGLVVFDWYSVLIRVYWLSTDRGIYT